MSLNRRRKIEDRKCFLCGICAEELTKNVIEHGIKKQKEIKTADIRVVIDGEDVIIRLRDGGPAFNLKHFADRLKEEDNLSEVYHRILIAKVPKKHDRLSV